MKERRNNMSAESAGGIAAAKWLWSVVFAPLIIWLFKKVDTLEEKSYSKQETDNQIKLHVDPVKEESRQTRREIDKLSTSINILSNVLTEFRVEVAKMSKDGHKDE